MKLILYVADEFKTLEGGKTLAIGLFTDRVVILNVPGNAPDPSHETPYGIPLGLLACVTELPTTELAASMSILPPTGSAVMGAKSVSVKGAIGDAVNMLFQFDPFLMTAEGLYTLNLTFEGLDVLSESFELRIRRTDDAKAAPVLLKRMANSDSA